MKKKSNVLYQLLVGATFLIPTGIYLFLSATIFNIQIDYKVYGDKDTGFEVVYREDTAFVYSNRGTINFDGEVTYSPELGTYGIRLELDEVMTFNNDYFVLERVDGVLGLNDVKRFALQKKEGVSLPITVIISILGVGIAFLVAKGKFKWLKEKPEIALFLSLLTGTIILYVINLFVSNIFNVFLILTASSFLYLIENKIHYAGVEDKSVDQAKQDLIEALKKGL